MDLLQPALSAFSFFFWLMARRAEGQSFCTALSEGSREAEDVFGDVGEDEVRGDRGDLVETRLAELALHVVLGVEAVAAEGLQGGVGRLPGGVGGQELRQIRLGAARLSPVEEGGRLLHHERGGLDVRVSPRYGELDALVLTDGPPENLTLAGAFCRLLYKPPSVAYALGGDEDALRVHAVQDVAETLSLFTDDALRREPETIEDDLARRVVHHQAPRLYGEAFR